MNILEKYKNLSAEDKGNLTIYSIYNDIYDSARNSNFNISDKDAMSIQETAYQLYLDDECYHLSAPEIAYFLTDCYAHDKNFISEMDDFDSDEILEAVDEYNLNFYDSKDAEYEI
jgi:hypothetical protein